MNIPDENPDRFGLSRFATAQEAIYPKALAELEAGHKRSHWMWFIFPQLAGLGSSPMAQRYAISGLEEARAYLAHPLLGVRLIECMEAVLGVEGRTAAQIFGFPDDLKFRSSLTLFEYAAGNETVVSSLLDKYYNGQRDTPTLALLAR